MTVKILEELCVEINDMEHFKGSSLSEAVKGWINKNEYSFGSVMQPARLALVGELKGIDLFLVMEFIGKEETIARLVKLSKNIKS